MFEWKCLQALRDENEKFIAILTKSGENASDEFLPEENSEPDAARGMKPLKMNPRGSIQQKHLTCNNFIYGGDINQVKLPSIL